MSSTTYPASPVDLPEKLTGLSPAYTIKAVLAVLAILLFFVLYAALVAAFGYLFYLAIIFEIPHVSLYTILMKLGAIAGAGMLLFFTIKFLFKLKNPERKNRIRLSREEHPELWNFVERICEETGAPRPKSIYVDPDVNAYVRYSNLWLSLLFPVRKELTIGLGLVNCLNLSQFKGVIAHEFGHFSQRSMRIGSYIASANTIIHDMIFTRDKWDELLAKWKTADIRLSIAAWLITPVIWIVRQILRLFYSFLNIMYASLSREMEFNADKVAVSVAGSDAIVSALWNIDGGAELWHGTLNNAYLATQKKLHTRNLYAHQTLAHQRIEPDVTAVLEALPADERGGRRYFTESKNSKAHMYASHPPNDLREASAKTPFVHCPVDERSPWILFPDPEKLQQEMSLIVYTTYFEKMPESFGEIEEFERFIEGETDGTDLAGDYLDTFRDRFLHIPDRQEMERSPINEKDIGEGLAFLKEEIVRLMKPVQELDEHYRTLQGMADGTLKQKTFTFNNVTYNKKEVNAAWTALVRRREQLFAESFIEWDTAFCALHMNLAEKLGRGEELERVYAQHLAITRMYQWILNGMNIITKNLEKLQEQSEVTPGQIASFGDLVRQIMGELNGKIDGLTEIDFVPLPNIDTVEELQGAIVEEGKFPVESGQIFEERRFGRAMESLERAHYHCRRVEQKSIALVLRVHAELQGEFEGAPREEASEEPAQGDLSLSEAMPGHSPE